MKTNLKRVAAMMLAVVMVCCLSVTAFAAGDQSLTVHGDTLGDKNVYAVKMFDARATASETGASYTFDSYELVAAWEDFFKEKIPSEATGTELSEAAFNHVSGLSGETLATFAHDAQKYVRDNSSKFSVVTVKASEGTAQFTSLDAGYYLVYPEGGSTGTDRNTDAMLVNVPRGENAVWNIKSTFPTVDKKVDTDNEGDGVPADNGSAQVGDTVTFTLTSKVPDMTDYSSFYFAFQDTLSSGLQFVQMTPEPEAIQPDDVKVTIGGGSVDSGYTVSLSDKSLTIVFNDLKSVPGADTGDEIVVTYKAMITKEAVTSNPATNTVKVVYSNDPKTDSKGESNPDESKVFTYDIDVNKWATDAGGKSGSLAGAKFVLSTSATLTNGESDASVIKLIGSGENYRVAEPGEDGTVSSFVTTNNGDINISGLEAGTYYLHEIEAPTGYNKLKAPIKIEITLENELTGDATIEVDGKPATGDDGTVVDVENKKGITLPETGSIGTIGLTVAGVAIVLIGVFAPRKKKTEQE